jgi:hypothetical protein
MLPGCAVSQAPRTGKSATADHSLTGIYSLLKQIPLTLAGCCDQAPAPVSTPSSSRFHNQATLWTSIREILGSNPGRDTGYND